MRFTKKEFDNPLYWNHFSRKMLPDELLPTPEEAVAFITQQRLTISNQATEIARLKVELRASNQQFQVFAMEVGNLANKYTRYDVTN